MAVLYIEGASVSLLRLGRSNAFPLFPTMTFGTTSHNEMGFDWIPLGWRLSECLFFFELCYGRKPISRFVYACLTLPAEEYAS